MGDFSVIPKVVNGGIAGIIGVSCVFPLDLVKTRLQNQQIGPNGEKMYSSMFDCFKKTYRAEGYFGMYRGASVNILLVTPEKAIKLAANDFFRYHFRTGDPRLPVTRQMAAGAMAGICQIVITTPMELLKIQMQDAGRVAAAAKLAGKTVVRKSATQLTLDMIRERGFFSLYKGLSPTLLRDVLFSIIYFPLFATLNEMGPRRSDGSGDAVFWWSFVSGCGGGSTAALTVTPVDVVKTRVQALTKAEGERKCSGMFDCASQILKYEGLAAFFKGGACRMIVVAPLFGIAQSVYYMGVAEMLLGYEYKHVK